MTKCPFCDKKELESKGVEFICKNCGYIITQEPKEKEEDNGKL